MAGSYTPYHDFTLIAKRNIVAGEELLADKNRNHEPQHSVLLAQMLPSVEEYTRADEIVNELMTSNLDLTEAQWIDVLHRIQHEILGSIDRKIAKMLPKSYFELKRAHERGMARLHLRDRSLAWIQSNGQCLDSIREGESSIADAGRGAFATYQFSKGAVITVSPLVQISNPQVLEFRERNHTNPNATHQLLFNYCYGHRKSELLLCPTTQVALMNHDSKRANVEIRWARNENMKDYTAGTVEDLQVDPDDLASYNTRLMFQYVAIGDIQAGDELFLDYGKGWENALLDHIEHGASSLDDHLNVGSSVLNDKNSPIVLSDDESVKSYLYECQIYPNVKLTTADTHAWEEFASNRAIDESNWPPEFRAWYKDNDFVSWYPCKVIKVDEEQELYAIEMFVKPLIAFRVGRRYLKVPRDRIRFAERPYQSDIHLAWSFRHYIPIPDSIFPLRWRDDYQLAESWNLGKLSDARETALVAEDYERTLREVKCGLYIAKSNIPNAGRLTMCFQLFLVC
jgi:hypothetical protein